MNSPRSRVFVALFVVTLLAVVLFVARGGVRTQAAVAPDAEVLASREPAVLAAPATAPVEVAHAEESAVVDEIPAAVVTTLASATSSSAEHLLYGLVKRPEGLASSPEGDFVGLTDGLGPMRRARSADDGAYSFAGLAAGRYWLTAGSSTGATAQAVVEIDGDRRLDLELVVPPTLLVKVVDRSGAPIEALGLFAVATAEQPGTWIDEIEGSLNNPFGVGQWWGQNFSEGMLPSGFLGRIVLRRPPPVFVSLMRYQYVVATRRVEVGETDVVFELDRADRVLQPGTLRFRLIDAATRAPVEKVTALLHGSGTRTSSSAGAQHEASELHPGRYVLRVSPRGHACRPRVVRIEPGQVLDLGDIEVEAAVTISGRIVDEEGQGFAPDVYYFACDDSGVRIASGGTAYSVNVKPDGSFQIGSLTRGLFELDVSAEDRVRTRPVVDVRGGSVEDLEIRVVRGTQVLLRSTSVGVDRPAVRVLDATGRSVWSTQALPFSPSSIRLAPGSYEVEITPSAGPARRVPVVVGTEPVALDLP